MKVIAAAIHNLDGFRQKRLRADFLEASGEKLFRNFDRAYAYFKSPRDIKELEQNFQFALGQYEIGSTIPFWGLIRECVRRNRQSGIANKLNAIEVRHQKYAARYSAVSTPATK